MGAESAGCVFGAEKSVVAQVGKPVWKMVAEQNNEIRDGELGIS